MEDSSVRGIDFQNGRMKTFKSVNDYIDALQKGVCPICGKPIKHHHHIVPRLKGGSDGPENIIGLCEGCHRKVHLNEKFAKKIDKIGQKKKYGALSVLNQAIPYIHPKIPEEFITTQKQAILRL